MLSIIYGHDLGTPESIAWLLCEENNIGPQIFQFDVNVNNDNGRLFNKTISDIRVNNKYFDDHNLCMQRMENLTNGPTGKNGPSQLAFENESVDFISHYRKYEQEFDHVVWANYYGLHHIYSRIEGADKVVFCSTNFLESFTHYITGYAFGTNNHKDIDLASEIWYKDHHLLDGKDTTQWKEYWYKLYHKKMHDAHDSGELKYMWQLNLMHWDLCNAITLGKGDPENIKLNAHDDLDRLWDDRIADVMTDTVDEQFNTSNSDIIDKSENWLDDLDEILDYLQIDKTENMQYNIVFTES